jgi:coenzyme F420 hydrogenase subunit beta
MALGQMRFGEINGYNPGERIGLVVGLFCTWALDFRLFESFVSQRVDRTKITKIDIPPPPAEILEVYTKEDKIEIPLAEVRESIPNSCGSCPDMTAEFSDLSVGVLEGDSGKNTTIVRTERGRDLLQAAEKAEYLVVEPYPDEAKTHLSWAAKNKKKRALQKLQSEGLLNTEQDGALSTLRLRPETLQQILSD